MSSESRVARPGRFAALGVIGLSAVALALVSTDAPAVELWSVDLQSANSDLYGQENPPAMMSGPDARFGIGNIWNDFSVDGHDLPPSVNPSLDLVDTDGNASPVVFSMTGNVSGFSNAPGGDPLFKDYIFSNAGGADVEFGWSITGLEPGGIYDMINYGGVGRDAALTIDLDGDGDLGNNTAIFAPLNTGLKTTGIIADASGTILGHMGPGNYGEANWGGFQLMRASDDPVEDVIGTLWSVDLEAVGGIVARPDPDTMMGVEPSYGFGDIWNAFEVAGHDGAQLDPTMDLVDSTGSETSVNLTVFGNVSGWSQGPTTRGPEDLINDYLFVNAGNADPNATWEISGLKPGGQYEMMIYGGVARDAAFTIDVEGDGDLANDTPLFASGGGRLFNITADANGIIHGSIAEGTAVEANWGGFQLRDMTPVSSLETFIWDQAGDGQWGTSSWVNQDGIAQNTYPAGETLAIVKTDTVTVAAPQDVLRLTIESGAVQVDATLKTAQFLSVGDNASLSLGTDGTVAVGGALTLGAAGAMTLGTGASLAAGSLSTAADAMITVGDSATVTSRGAVDVATVSLDTLSTLQAAGGDIATATAKGTVTLDLTGDTSIGTLSDGGAADTTIIKQGAGTLTLAHDGVSTVSTTNIEIQAGTLDAGGSAPLGDAATVTLAGGTLRLANPIILSGTPVIAQDELIQDLDADMGVTADGANLVSLWANQATSGGDDVAQADPNLQPTLVTGVVNGHNALSLTEDGGGTGDRMFGDDREAFNGLIDGTGNSWFVVTRVGEQVGDGHNNRFFGTLTEADYSAGYTGICPGVNEGEVPYNLTRAGGHDITHAPAPINDGAFHIVAGRLQAGTGLVTDELFIDSPYAVAANSNITVNPWANSDLLSIGVERLTGVEDYVGEIARILIYDQPLSNKEMFETALALQQTYAIDATFDSFSSNEPVDMSGTELVLTADSTLDVTGGGTFGGLMLNAGTLAIQGSDPISFGATTVAQGAARVALDPRVATSLGVIDGALQAATIAKVGSGDLVLDESAVNVQDTTLSVEGGRLIAIGGALSPIGDATLAIDGGEAVLASAAGDVAFDNTIAIVSNGILTAGSGGVGAVGPLTVTVGSETSGLVVDGATLTLQATEDYELNIAGPISGGGEISVDTGSITFGGAGSSIGSLQITGGTVGTVGNDVAVTDTLRVGDISYGVDPGATFQIRGSDLMAGADLTLGGGTIHVATSGSPPGAIGYWAFDEADGSVIVSDTSGSDVNYDGDVIGIGTFVPGKIGNAMEFDGFENYVDLPDGFDDFTGGLTIAAWVNFATNDNLWARIVDFSVAPGDNNVLFAQINTEARARFEVRTGTGGGAGFVDTSTAVIPLDEWVHLATTLDTDGKAVIYQNGQEVAVAGMWMPQNVVRVNNYIGKSAWDGDGLFQGLMDEVYVYDRGLSAEEVGVLYGDGDGPVIGELALETTNFEVTADATLHLDSYLDASLGSLKVAEGVALEITGAAASLVNIDTGDGVSIEADALFVGGVLSPGEGVAQLNLDCELEFDDDGSYRAQLAGDSNDYVAALADIYLAGTLNLEATARLDQVGGSTRTIMAVVDEDEESMVEDAFAVEPSPGDHLGFGTFLNEIVYEDRSVSVDVFQAAYGDLNGDKQVNILDIFKIKSSPKGFGSGATDAEWTDGDMVGANPMLPADGMVTLMDIFAIKQAGHFGAGAYAAGVETLVDEDGTAQLIYDAATGELTLQNEDGVEAILLESAAGLFIGEADETLANFVELTPEVFGAVSFDGALPMGSLGMVLPAGLDEATLTGDLTILGSAELIYQAVPEPGTLALLAMGFVGLLAWRRRRV